MDEVEKALWELRLRAEEIWQANQRRINNKKDDVSYQTARKTSSLQDGDIRRELSS